MKLRVRSVETNQTHRVETPNPCTISLLKQIISNFSNPNSQILPNNLHLSLNRKDELITSSPEQPIQSAGVTSGDLIYYTTNPNLFLNQIGGGSEAVVGVQENQVLGYPVGGIEGKMSNLGSVGALELGSVSTSPNPNPNLCRELGKADETSQTLVFDSGESTENRNLGTVTGETSMVEDTVEEKPEKGLDLGAGEKLEKRDLGSVEEQSMVVLDCENGEGKSGDFMEEDGDGVVEDVENGRNFSVPGFLRKVFTEELSGDEVSGGGFENKLLGIAVHAVLLESGFVGFDPVSRALDGKFRVPKYWHSASFYYTLPEVFSGGQVEAVKIKFQIMGNVCSVYGSLVNGNGMYWVKLDGGRVATVLNVVWANCGSVVGTPEKDGFSSIFPEKEVFEFWRKVKDGIALPLLIDLCVKSGLGLPPCFTRLPTELKLKILELVSGTDLAAMGSVCSELRYLTSDDDLWKKKYIEQFGDAEGSGEGRNYKDKFAKSWENRKRRKYARTSFGSLRRNIIRPVRFPQPRIIGGDYDLWPSLNAGGFTLLDSHNQQGGGYRRLRNLVPRCNLGGLND